MFAPQPHRAEAVQRDRERQRDRHLEERRQHLALRHSPRPQRHWRRQVSAGPTGRAPLTALARAHAMLGWQAAGLYAGIRVLVKEPG